MSVDPIDWGRPFGVPSLGRRYSSSQTARGQRAFVPTLPVVSLRQLRTLLKDYDGDVGDWTSYAIPGSRRYVWLPNSFDDNWEERVVTIATAVEVDDGMSPVGWVEREEICVTGDIWMIVESRDGDVAPRIVGQFQDYSEGLWQCITRSKAFISGPGRTVVGPEEAYGLFDDPVDITDELEDDPESWALPLKSIQSLVVKTARGVVVGSSPDAEVPSEGHWWLIPMSEPDGRDLAVSGCDVEFISVTVRESTRPAVLVRLPESLGLPLARSHGLSEVVVLNGSQLFVVKVAHESCAISFGSTQLPGSSFSV